MTLSIILSAYLVGSIPFALWLTRRSDGRDVRRVGSGNVGATNASRIAGASTGLLVLALDVGKGMAVVLCVCWLGASVPIQATAAAAVVLGHVFPVWLKFQGGKGVATSAGAFSTLTPCAVLVAVGIFAGLVWWTRFVSVGSLAAVLLLVPLAFIEGASLPVLFAACLVSLIILTRHRSNVARLLSGREDRVGHRL